MNVAPQISFWRWISACGFAEFFGIATAALWWVAMDRLEPDPPRLGGQLAMLGLKGASGLLEGAILGFAQAIVLRRSLPLLSLRGWVAATIILAVLGWLLGSAPSIFFPVEGAGQPLLEPSLAQMVALAALFGLTIGAAFGGAQWLVLRHAARRAWLWIPANIAGWMAALPLIYLSASVGADELSLVEVTARAVSGGFGAGLVLGAITYLFLRRIIPREEEPFAAA